MSHVHRANQLNISVSDETSARLNEWLRDCNNQLIQSDHCDCYDFVGMITLPNGAAVREFKCERKLGDKSPDEFIIEGMSCISSMRAERIARDAVTILVEACG